MIDFLIRWWRRKRFIKAYKILRDEADRHLGAGHDTTFVALSEAHVYLKCAHCPDLQPRALKHRLY